MIERAHIYELEGDTNKFPGFIQVYAESAPDELWNQSIGHRSAAAAGESIKDGHLPVKLQFDNEGKKKDVVADLSYRMAPFLILRERAVNALKDVLAPAGEFLTIDAPVPGYTGFHVMRCIRECVDLDKSKYTRYDNGSIVVRKAAFVAAKVQDEHIFVIPEAPTSVFVSHAFKTLVEGSKLKGFVFHDTIEFG